MIGGGGEANGGGNGDKVMISVDRVGGCSTLSTGRASALERVTGSVEMESSCVSTASGCGGSVIVKVARTEADSTV